MDIQYLKLRGFTGIKKGLGLDEISFDFSQDAGMIALSGPTGSGKTTIMENLQPFPQLISRPEKALKNHVFLKNSSKELVFNYAGSQYKTLTKIDAESGRAEGFVWQNGQPQVNGKISEYARYITKLFGSQNLFFNSVFCAQNSIKISGLRPAELKALFAEFLGTRLQKLTEYESTSKDCVTSLMAKTSSVDESIQKCREIADQETALKDALIEKSFAEIDATNAIKKEKETLNEQRKTLTNHRVQLAESKQIQQRIIGIENNIDEMNKDLDESNQLADREISEINGKAQNTQLKINEVEILLKNKSEILQAKDEANRLSAMFADINQNLNILNEKIQAKTKEIYNAKTHHGEKTAIAKSAAIKIAQNKIDIKSKEVGIQNDIDHTNKKIEGLQSDPKLLNINFEIKSLKSKTMDLEKRDPDCKSTTCSFIIGALDARARLPIAKRELTVIKNKINKTKEELESAIVVYAHDAKKAFTELDANTIEETSFLEKIRKEWKDRDIKIKKLEAENVDITVEIGEITDSKVKLMIKQTAAEKIASKVQDILLAEDRRISLSAYREELIAMVADKKKAIEIIIAQKQAQIKNMFTEIAMLQKQIDNDLPDKIMTSENEINFASNEIEKREKNLTEIKSEVAFIEKNLAESQKAIKEKKELEEKRDRLIKESSEWAYLKDACGANGLRALEINSVAPSITHDANLLLEQAFGAWAMVDFRTQNDDGKEVLEPRVIDQDGDSVLIGNRSGGQQVWALKALRLAMTMISKKRSGKDFQTIFCDEDDAGLDIETAQSFTMLYRALMEMGGFKKCFYISHKPECVAMADRVICLEK